MKFLRVVVFIVITGLSPVLIAQTAPSPEAQLKAAIDRELVDGDLNGAIERYKDITERFASNRPVAAKALLQLAGIYERQGKADARLAYQRIVTEYADTGATANTARARLSAMQQPAGPFRARDLNALVAGAPNIRIAWSPDGKYVVYSKPGPTNPWSLPEGLWIRDLPSGRERPLGAFSLKSGEITFSNFIWAPDSQRGVIAVRVPSGSLEFRTVAVPSGETRAIGTSDARLGSSFAWSPDGKRLAYLATQSIGTKEPVAAVIHVISVGPKQIPPVKLGETTTPPGGLVWSPDGTSVAFMAPAASAAGPAIRVVNVSSLESRLISTPPAAASTSRTFLDAWTATNQLKFRQTVINGGDDYLVEAAGGVPRKICEGRGGFGGDGCQMLSPDGTLQVARRNVTGGGRIVLRNIATGEERPLTHEAVAEQTAGGFSRDGKLFAFRSNRDGKWALYVVPIDQIPVVNPLKIATLNSEGISSQWAGNHLVLRLNESETNLFRIDLDVLSATPAASPARLTQDTTRNLAPFVSPDGRLIAYTSRAGQRQGFCVMEANGSRERVIHEVPADKLTRMQLIGWWSNDELLVADRSNLPVSGRGVPLPRTLMVVNVTTGQMRPTSLPPLGPGGKIFAPGNDGLVYGLGDNVYRYRSLQTGAERPIAIPDGWEDFVLSRDGQLVAFGIVEPRSAESRSAGKPIPGTLRVRNADGTNDRILAASADTKGGNLIPLAWSPSGKFLLYQDPDLNPLVMNVDTKESWPLLKNPPRDVIFDWPAASWSPDGSFIVIEGSTTIINWQRVEDITYETVTKLTGARKR